MDYINLTPETLAKIVREAARLKEESYDHTAADKAEKGAKFVDYKQFYTLNLEQAVEQAVMKFKVDPRFSQYIYLSFHWWNNILDWEEHPAYTTTYWSISGLKAVLMSWDKELGDYAPWMTGPTFKKSEDSKQWAKDWAKAEGIEYKP